MYGCNSEAVVWAYPFQYSYGIHNNRILEYYRRFSVYVWQAMARVVLLLVICLTCLCEGNRDTTLWNAHLEMHATAENLRDIDA